MVGPRAITRTVVDLIAILTASIAVGAILTVTRPENRTLLLLLVGGLGCASAAFFVAGKAKAASRQLGLRLVGWLLVLLLAALTIPTLAGSPRPATPTAASTPTLVFLLLAMLISAVCGGVALGLLVLSVRRARA